MLITVSEVYHIMANSSTIKAKRRYEHYMAGLTHDEYHLAMPDTHVQHIHYKHSTTQIHINYNNSLPIIVA